jgi:dienelactone hydrolase
MGKLSEMLPNGAVAWLKAQRDLEPARRRSHFAWANLVREAKQLSELCLTDMQTLEQWQCQAPVLRSQLARMLGLDHLPKRAALEAEVTGVLDRPGFRVENVVFQSLSGLRVTGNFYLPKEIKGPVPVILYLCGHIAHPLGAKTAYQDRYLWYPAHGFGCLALDPLGYGEVPGIHHGTQDLNYWHWLSLGYTPAGVEVWNAIRALDWLQTRQEVDAQRIGVTGISGGGVMSWYLAALDDRIAVAAPSCSTFTLGSQVAGGLVPGQCDCTFYPNIYGLDFPVVAALIAPRPLLITSGQRDRLFPPAGYREVFCRAKRIYDLYPDQTGHPRIRKVEADVGHEDAPIFLQESRRWMGRWLAGKDPGAEVMNNGPAAEPPEHLRCLQSLPVDAANYRIDTRFIEPCTPVGPSSAGAWLERKKNLTTLLHDEIFRWFPKGPIPYQTRVLRVRPSDAGAYAQVREREIQSESGVFVRVRLFTPHSTDQSLPLVVVIRRNAEVVHLGMDELLPLLPRANVLVVNPRFSERTLQPEEYATIERSAVLVGRTVAAMQIWDVIRAARWALAEEGFSPSSLSVYGRGASALLAVYAALMEERIARVVVAGPPESHRQGPALLTILRHTDLPEVAAMLAPRELVFLDGRPPAYALTRAIYGVQGADARLRTVAGFLEAIIPTTTETGPARAMPGRT